MRTIATKSNGDSYPPEIFNSLRDELENTVNSSDQTLDSEAGPDTDLNMLGKAVALYSGAGDFYQDGGSANAYVLTRATNLKDVPSYKDGLLVVWKASVVNTGASTINISSIGVVALVDENGAALVGGEVSISYFNYARYNNSSSKFQLITQIRSISLENAVIDGGMLVDEGVSISITGSYLYGENPLIAAKADGTPTNGTIEKAETVLLGSTGFACILKDVTIGASGKVYYRYRIESRDVRRFIDQKAIVHCKVYHDVGSSINYTITVNKATVEDNFTSVTNINTSGSLAVSSVTETQISFIISDMGSCEDGVEIIIAATTGAITTKDFYLTELVLQLGGDITPFPHEKISVLKNSILRYFERWVSSNSIDAMIAVGQTTSTGAATFVINMQSKRTLSTITEAAVSDFVIIGGSIVGTITSIVGTMHTNDFFTLVVSVSGTPWTNGDASRFKFDTGISGFIQFDARL